MDVTDHHQHQQVFRLRVVITFIICFLVLSVLLGRLAYLQLSSHEHFDALSQNNRVRLQATPPPRGLIYDRNGKILAENRPSFRLEIVPEQAGDIDATIAALSEFFDIADHELQRFRRAIRREGRFRAIPLKFNLNEEEVARFAVNQHRFPGAEIAGYLSRYYPGRALAAHAIGYVGRINAKEQAKLDNNPEDKANYSASTHIGKTGIEQAYEDILHGQVGYRTVEVNAEGRVVRVLEENKPVPGRDIYLTIDSDIQRVAEKSLGEEAGAILLMDVHTGQVLAFVSMPVYDLQPFVNGISFSAYAALRDDEDIPLFNRVVRGRYPPGSILKPFVGLGALEKQLPFARQKYHCKGVYQLDNDKTNHKYRDWKKGGHGRVGLHDSIVESCDVYFYELAYQLGIDSIHNMLTGFGFGKRTGIDIAGEKAGLIPNRDWKKRTYKEPWFDGETLISGIGQGFMLTTPLQLVSATAALATDGKRYQPHLLHAVYNDDGNEPIYMPAKPLANVPVKDPNNWQAVKKAMQDVVEGRKGTAKRVKNKSYTVAGKTGTAQVKSIAQDEEYDAEKLAKKQRDHALFAAYAPAEKPEVAVLVLVENGGSGGSVAAPIAKKVLDAYMLRESKNVATKQ